MSVGLGRGACFGCGASRWCGREHRRKAAHDSSLSGRMSRAGRPRAGPTDACMCRGGGCCTLTLALRWWKPRNRAEQQFWWWPRFRSHVRRPPSPHMGARPPHTLVARKTCNSNKNQSPPRKIPSLPCATPKTATPTSRTTPPRCRPRRSDTPRPTSRSVHFRLEIGPVQPGQPDVEARTTNSGGEDHMPHLAAVGDQQILSSTTDLEAECDRSRGGVRPISVRASTDLAAEPDRSRHRLDTAPDAENKHHPTPTNAPQPAPRSRRIESAHHACPPTDQSLDPPVASIVCPVIHRAASLAR